MVGKIFQIKGKNNPGRFEYFAGESMTQEERGEGIEARKGDREGGKGEGEGSG